jgi:hypothetical protein
VGFENGEFWGKIGLLPARIVDSSKTPRARRSKIGNNRHLRPTNVTANCFAGRSGGAGEHIVKHTVATGRRGFADCKYHYRDPVATSSANTAVTSSASTALTIAASQGVSASFNPATQTLTQPGAADFLLNVDNIGNTEDAYTASIVGTSGPVTAALMGLDEHPTQSIPTFILPVWPKGLWS